MMDTVELANEAVLGYVVAAAVVVEEQVVGGAVGLWPGQLGESTTAAAGAAMGRLLTDVATAAVKEAKPEMVAVLVARHWDTMSDVEKGQVLVAGTRGAGRRNRPMFAEAVGVMQVLVGMGVVERDGGGRGEGSAGDRGVVVTFHHHLAMSLGM